MSNAPLDVIIVGQALNSDGFQGPAGAISGLGLNTFGFLWPCSDIWTNSENSITTVWTNSVTQTTVEVCTD